MEFNYAKLRGKIVEVYGSQKDLSKAIGISEQTISSKLNNKKYWTQSEIEKMCELLNISPAEITAYFFTPEIE